MMIPHMRHDIGRKRRGKSSMQVMTILRGGNLRAPHLAHAMIEWSHLRYFGALQDCTACHETAETRLRKKNRQLRAPRRTGARGKRERTER